MERVTGLIVAAVFKMTYLWPFSIVQMKYSGEKTLKNDFNSTWTYDEQNCHD